MKVHSILHDEAFLELGLSGSLEVNRVQIRHTVSGVLADRYTDFQLPIQESAFTVLEEGRSLGKAAMGAIAGGVLTGGIGLLAGGAIGGRKKHTVAQKCGKTVAVLTLTTDELKTLAGRGVEFGEQRKGDSGRALVKQSSSVNIASVISMLFGLLLLLGWLLSD